MYNHNIYGGQVLPRALTKEEEKYYLESSVKNSEEARKKLIEHNLRLVAYIAQKFKNSGVSQEDLVSIGTIGLIKGIDTFDLDKKTKLATYASRCIENEILMYFRVNNKYQNNTSIYDAICEDIDGNKISFEDILYDPIYRVDDNIEDEETYNELRNLLKMFNDKEIEIIKFRFGFYEEIKTQREVAKILGYSQSYVCRIEKKLLKVLKKYLKIQMFGKEDALVVNEKIKKLKI